MLHLSLVGAVLVFVSGCGVLGLSVPCIDDDACLNSRRIGVVNSRPSGANRPYVHDANAS